MMVGVGLTQWSAAIVLRVFPVLGPSATSAWRFLLGALVLLAFARPNLRGWTRRQWLGALALGVTTAFMNQCFYEAIERIPLGGAVAIEYLGPFCVAAFGKRSLRRLPLVVLAGLGVVALTRPGNGLTVDGVLLRRRLGTRVGVVHLLLATGRRYDRRALRDSRCRCPIAAHRDAAAVVRLERKLLVDHPGTFGRLLLVAVMAIVLGFGADLQGLRRIAPSGRGRPVGARSRRRLLRRLAAAAPARAGLGLRRAGLRGGRGRRRHLSRESTRASSYPRPASGKTALPLG